MKALVIDYSAMMRNILTRTVERAGITEIEQASDGRQALTAILENEYDIVLLDWNLPSMPGIEVVKAIRSNGKNMPVFMVSSNMRKTRIFDALKAGATYYFIKLFKQYTFVGKIREILEGIS
ncbi:MAG: response regulator [Planctomycetota bacterium]|jgi:two-component system chemotaxis response regulator CheY